MRDFRGRYKYELRRIFDTSSTAFLERVIYRAIDAFLKSEKVELIEFTRPGRRELLFKKLFKNVVSCAPNLYMSVSEGFKKRSEIWFSDTESDSSEAIDDFINDDCFIDDDGF